MKNSYIPISKIREMSDDELIELSKERNRKGCFTQNAENAMRVRRERSGSSQWYGINRKAPSHIAQEISYKGQNITKKFK